MSLKFRASTGIIWNGVNKIVEQAFRFLTVALLARLLAPDDFGLLGMATTLTSAVAVFNNLGFGSSIIRSDEISQGELSSLFWLNLLFSGGLAVITVGLAPLASAFYSAPSILPIVAVLACSFPISASAMVQKSLLRKEMRFRKLAVIGAVSTSISSLIGIATAFIGFGVWALVLHSFTYTVCETILFWVTDHWRPNLGLSVAKIKRHIRFGVELQLGTVLNYAARNLDDIMVGRIIGTEALGLYQMAYRLMLWPLQNVSQVINGVLFPTLSSIKKDRRRTKRMFLTSTSYIATLTFPMTFGAFVVAPSAIPLLLGQKWTGVVPVFRVLCFVGMLQSIVTNTGTLYVSYGRTRTRLKMLTLTAAVFSLSFAIGANWGSIGMAIGYLIANLLLIPFQITVAGKTIDISLAEIIDEIDSVFFCAFGMSICVWVIGALLPVSTSAWVRLGTQILLGIAVYVVSASISKCKPFYGLVEVMRDLFHTMRQKGELSRELG